MQKGLIIHTVISNDKGEILLLQRSKNDDILPGYWDIPGGTLEDGENPETGAIRETKEETGLEFSNLKLFFQKSNVDVPKNKQFVTLIFHAKTISTNVTLSPEDHDSYIWIEPSKINNYKTVDYLTDCIEAYIELKF